MTSSHTQALRKIVPFLLLPAGVGLLFKMAIAPSLAQTVLAFALAIFCPELTRMAWIDLKNIEIIATDQASATVTNTVSSTASSTVTPSISATQIEPSAEHLDQTQQLHRFRTVVVSTIVLEATGFYLTFLSLPVGATAIMLSQVWFNLLAAVQLQPSQPVPVVPFGIRDRRAVLAVNAITAGLLCLWPIPSMRLGLAVALLTLVTLFLAIKYGYLRSA